MKGGRNSKKNKIIRKLYINYRKIITIILIALTIITFIYILIRINKSYSMKSEDSIEFSKNYYLKNTKENNMFIHLFDKNNINNKNSNSYIIQNTPKIKVQFLKILKQYNSNILIKNISFNIKENKNQRICIKNIFEMEDDDYNISPQKVYDSLKFEDKENIKKYYLKLNHKNPQNYDFNYKKVINSDFKKIYLKDIDSIKNTMIKIFLDNLHLKYIPEKYVVKNTKEKNNDFEYSNWSIYFPKTNENYNIYETVSNEVLNKGIGHFSESKKIKGNIALAGHNRGYKVNSFSHLKNIKEGEEIYYKYRKEIFKYIVSTKEKISEYDYSKVERTGDFLTLITCVENRPELRLCVTAIRKKP